MTGRNWRRDRRLGDFAPSRTRAFEYDDLPEEPPSYCMCPRSRQEQIGGIWLALDVTQCARCGRPPEP